MQATLCDLEAQVDVQLVIADRADPQGIKFIQWRPAFYVAGAIRTSVLFLIDQIIFTLDLAEFEGPFDVYIFPHVRVELSKVGLKASQHRVGKRVISLHIQLQSPEMLSNAITGIAWAFRKRLDMCGVPN